MNSLSKILLVLLPWIAVGPLQAQIGANPNAVDLSKFIRTLDSGAGYNYNGTFPIGDIDGDGVEDLLIHRTHTDDTGRVTRHDYVITDLEGTIERSPIELPHSPILTGDFNGDGVPDVVTYESTAGGQNHHIHWGAKVNGNLQIASTSILERSPLENRFPVIAQDLTGDGITDLVQRSDTKLYLNKGRLDMAQRPTIVPYDSLDISAHVLTYQLEFFAGNFGSGPAIVHASSDWAHDAASSAILKLTHIQLGTSAPFSDATIVDLYVDTIPHQQAFVYVPAMAVGEVTGDQFDDILVQRVDTVLVFKGAADIAQTRLNNASAEVIRSPKSLDPVRFSHLGSIEAIHFLGDLTGSGIPMFAIRMDAYNTVASLKYVLLYAGGEVLDTYFDAYTVDTNVWISALNTIDVQHSKRALVYLQTRSGVSEVAYLREGLETIPQTKASVKRNLIAIQELSIRYVDNGILISTIGVNPTLGIYDLLGRLVKTVELTHGIATVETQSLTPGVYHVRASDATQGQHGKFIR